LNTTFVGRNHPETAKAMGRHFEPRSGTVALEILDLIRAHGGLTDYEVSAITGRSHQAVSGIRKGALVDRGLVVDSGERRLNEYSHNVIVWRAVT
jgi:hypothetical protein